MSIVFEIVVYIVLTFCIMMLSIAFCEKSLNNKERYIRMKKEGTSVKIKLSIDGIDEKDKKTIVDIIEKGKYESVYDIVDECVLE